MSGPGAASRRVPSGRRRSRGFSCHCLNRPGALLIQGRAARISRELYTRAPAGPLSRCETLESVAFRQVLLADAATNNLPIKFVCRPID